MVDVTVSTSNHIVVEIDTQNGVNIDFCAELSRHIESQLDREVEDYELEVGSAGLTAPFKVIEQYHKNKGNEVDVLTKEGKKITGILTGGMRYGINLTFTQIFIQPVSGAESPSWRLLISKGEYPP